MTVARFCNTDELPADSHLILFVGNDLITDQNAEPLLSAKAMAAFWYAQNRIPDISWRLVAERQGVTVYSARSTEWADWQERYPEQFRQIGFRALLPELDQSDFELIASASQLLTWEQDHNFCCRCGSKARIHPVENAMCCDRCGYRQYPRINPCIIALITRGDEVLLAHNANFKPGYFSCIAGFIEPGESVEQAVHREIEEEVGIKVKNLRYVTSQSWPFPHSLMLGFLCEYDSGEIQVDGEEILEARWGKLESFPYRPGSFAISGQLMSLFEAEQNTTNK